MFCKYPIIGLHLLLLSHIAHTFVLLTANIEDVKKLARKFVSESLAEKIAEIIVKATEEIASNVSPETARDDSHQVSEENNKYNIERQGDSGQDIVKSKEDTTDKQDSKSYEVTTVDDGVKKRGAPKLEGQSRYASVEPKAIVKQYYPFQEKKQISKISEEDEKYEKENKQNKLIEDNFVSVVTTESDVKVLPIKPRKHKEKGRPYRLLAQGTSLEENDVDQTQRNYTIDDTGTLFQNRAVELTTRRAVFEFDEYDSSNYPKSKFAGSSGAMIMSGVTSEAMPDSRSEKDMPDII